MAAFANVPVGWKLDLASRLHEYAHLAKPRTRLASRGQQLLRALYWLGFGHSDPVVRMRVHGLELYLHASHDLPMLARQWPYYDTALPRLAAFLTQHQGPLTLIDVGANVGDTVAFVAAQAPGRFLCVEGDPRYLDLLRINLRNVAGVEVAHALVAEQKGEAPTFLHDRGTSRLAPTTSAASTTTTVDALMDVHPTFRAADVLKIDTDGYDYRVLRGAERLLTGRHPLLYFECSPDHLRLIGGEEDPCAIFPYLARLGYSQALFYDLTGLPMLRVAVTDRDRIADLMTYADIKGVFYYDVLAVHESQDEVFRAFCQEERARFPVRHWVTV